MHPLLVKAEVKYVNDVHEPVNAGDTVRISSKIKEGNKERIQIFEGVVLAIRGEGLSKMLKVRKISYGIGVERTFPLHSPNVQKIELVKHGKPRRAKLFYLRERIGKQALRVKEDPKYRGRHHIHAKKSAQKLASTQTSPDQQAHLSSSPEVATHSPKDIAPSKVSEAPKTSETSS